VQAVNLLQRARLAPREPPRGNAQPQRHMAKVATHEQPAVVAHERDAAEAVGLERLDFDGVVG
jgi:hypothetical protein